ncbi:AMP-binding protein [Corynebacterium sp. 320]|uniref:FadD32-like long-chain-fatty-acid--AMP ligase n=1 Tax=Corynebacterium TaxID=1716 RepID=UPI00125CC0AF|nr:MULTISPECIES: FadD32-like long-chain-fatty-acid--AMP ligase [Corynebacterium]KAB1504335.1 AMP-binding protein [Corynebacterium sp. 320]KAB1552565.1 AMP-binding protein [Corynebacterium sp. 321]KAB3528471.1 AMP-binding protein [Corynebacterium sp. 250]QNP92011.1 AMP-binding protein [Corynebacterium zhongnanshanii]
MDISAAMQQFYDDEGKINIPDQLTLSGMSEMLYTMAQMEGTTDSVLIRYHDYTASREGDVKEITRAEVNTRIKAVCVRLQQVANKGDRVAILMNNSPEYMYAFLGAMYAKLVPVPLYDPNEPGHSGHLSAVLGSSEPKVVLTNKVSAAAVRQHFSSVPAAERPRVLTVDALPDSLAEEWVNPMMAIMADPSLAPSSSDEAFLQYTSGSTRTPAGVILTHKSIVTNVLQIFQAAQLKTPLRLSTWLPMHHDMGLILAAFVIILGIPFDLMSPRDFIQDPARWLKQINRREDEENVYTVVPNFAMELAVRYADPEKVQGLEGLDLSRVDGIINGSEPVHNSSVQKFLDVFGKYGLERAAVRPSYGLAEATLLVTTPTTDERPLAKWFDREQLSAGVAQEREEGDAAAMPLMSLGQVCAPQVMCIVDPETGKEVADGTVGEIWVHGENMAAGYLGREEETKETFHNTLALADRLEEGSRSEGAAEDMWMRTGDLAVIVDDHLFITGRLKDLIIVAGRNHYPQDIEATADESTEQTAPAVIAAFAVSEGDIEGLVIIAERDPEADAANDAEAVEAIRAAVTKTHGVQPEDVKIVDPGKLPRSSANKIARRVAAKAYADGNI